jgi:hypothetical protein
MNVSTKQWLLDLLLDQLGHCTLEKVRKKDFIDAQLVWHNQRARILGAMKLVEQGPEEPKP